MGYPDEKLVDACWISRLKTRIDDEYEEDRDKINYKYTQATFQNNLGVDETE